MQKIAELNEKKVECPVCARLTHVERNAHGDEPRVYAYERVCPCHGVISTVLS